MKFTKLLQIIFILNNISYIFGFVYKLNFIFYLQYLINIFVSIFILKKLNKSEIILFFIGFSTISMEIIFSFVYDLFNPNFAVSSSILIYLIYKRLFLNNSQKLYFLLTLLTISSTLLIPFFNIYDVVEYESIDKIMITRNGPTYLYIALLNLVILNISKTITLENKLKLKKSKINLLTLYVILLSLNTSFLLIFYYSASLASIIMGLFSTLSIIFLGLELIWNNKLTKITTLFLSSIGSIFIINKFWDILMTGLSAIWVLNNDVQGSIFRSYRTDYIGFLRCFLDYPFGTGFYGMEKLCLDQSFYNLPDGIQPHSALVSFLLGYPIISLFIIIFILKNKNLRYKIKNSLLIVQSSNQKLKNFSLINIASLFHILSFLMSLLTSEVPLKFPYF